MKSLRRVISFAVPCWCLGVALAAAPDFRDLVSRGDMQALAATITQKNINQPDKRGNAPLHYASARVAVSAVTLLLDRGADVNVLNATYGTTPLHEVARTVSQDRKAIVSCARLLLEKGADAGIVDKQGETALVAAARYGNSPVVRVLLDSRPELTAGEAVRQALSVAREAGRYEIVSLLESKGIQSDAGKATGLLNAARLGNFSMIEQLRIAGADLEATTQAGETALYLAALQGHREVAKYLLEQGARVDAPAADGSTPLQVAADKGRGEIVDLLLDRGADINRSSSTFGTALNAAAATERVDLVNHLIERGAVPAVVGETGEQAFGSGLAWRLYAEYHEPNAAPAATTERRATALGMLEAARSKFDEQRVRFEQDRAKQRRHDMMTEALATAIASTIVVATEYAMQEQQLAAQRQTDQILALKGATSYSDYHSRYAQYQRAMVNPTTNLPYRIDIKDTSRVNPSSTLGLDLIISEYQRRIALTEKLLAES